LRPAAADVGQSSSPARSPPGQPAMPAFSQRHGPAERPRRRRTRRRHSPPGSSESWVPVVFIGLRRLWRSLRDGWVQLDEGCDAAPRWLRLSVGCSATGTEFALCEAGAAGASSPRTGSGAMPLFATDPTNPNLSRMRRRAGGAASVGAQVPQKVR
jgi:hypothetical protein